MKTPLFLNSVLFASLILCTFSARGILYTSIPGVFSTGVDDSGSPLAVGSMDSHWSIGASPVGSSSAKVSDTYFMWIGNTPSSAWINGGGSSAYSPPAGVYTYTMTFSLAGFDLSTAQITGQWASDNASSIYLNGLSTGISNTNIAPWGFAHFTSFTLTNGFVAGENTLSFAVTQDPDGASNPTGLQVDIFDAVASVPEPGPLALVGIAGLCWIAADSFRRKHISSKSSNKSVKPATPLGVSKSFST
jgi:hypothetical protein